MIPVTTIKNMLNIGVTKNKTKKKKNYFRLLHLITDFYSSTIHMGDFYFYQVISKKIPLYNTAHTHTHTHTHTHLPSHTVRVERWYNFLVFQSWCGKTISYNQLSFIDCNPATVRCHDKVISPPLSLPSLSNNFPLTVFYGRASSPAHLREQVLSSFRGVSFICCLIGNNHICVLRATAVDLSAFWVLLHVSLVRVSALSRRRRTCHVEKELRDDWIRCTNSISFCVW